VPDPSSKFRRFRTEPVPAFSSGSTKRRRHFSNLAPGGFSCSPAAYFLNTSLRRNKVLVAELGGSLLTPSLMTKLPSAPGFSAALTLSLKTRWRRWWSPPLLMVPTAIYFTVRLPQLRRVLDVVTVLPIVIPPIVLIVGVLGAYPLWAKSSPLPAELHVRHSRHALRLSIARRRPGPPFDLKTLTEASRSLGGNCSRRCGESYCPTSAGAAVRDGTHPGTGLW